MTRHFKVTTSFNLSYTNTPTCSLAAAGGESGHEPTLSDSARHVR